MGVLIYAKHLDTLAQFYSDVLQLAEEPKPERCTIWIVGAARPWYIFLLHAIPVQYAEDIVIAIPPQPREESAFGSFSVMCMIWRTLHSI